LKKEAKTFATWRKWLGEHPAKRQSFLVLFFKKELLPTTLFSPDAASTVPKIPSP
jgi:hypothetical protein